jgi:hypothetical protein
MRRLLVLGLLGLAGCGSDLNADAVKPGPPEVASTVASSPMGTVTPVQAETKNCREFTVPIKVGNEEKQAYGRACEQADGSWQIVQPDGAKPPTVIEHTNIYPSYPYWGPWGPWWGPWGWSEFGVVGVHHRHHHHHHHGHGHGHR